MPATRRFIMGPTRMPQVLAGTTTLGSQTLSGANSYANLVISPNSTLTLASGATLTVSGMLIINTGSTLRTAGSGTGISVYAGLLVNQGTLTSSNASDIFSFLGSSQFGQTTTVAGTMTLLAGDHAFGVTITGTGTLSVAQGANLTVPFGSTGTLSPTTLSTTAGTAASVVANGTLVIGTSITVNSTGNLFLSGTGGLSVATGISTTLGATVIWFFSSYAGLGTIVAGAYNLYAKVSTSWSLANFTALTGGTLQPQAATTLTFTGACTFTAGTTPANTGSLGGIATGTLAGSSGLTFVGSWYVNGANATLTYTGATTVTGATTNVIWVDNRLVRGTTANATLSPPFTTSGTGCLVMAPNIPGLAGTGAITFTVGTLTAGTPSGATATTSTKLFTLTGNTTSTWTPSATGSYYLGGMDTTAVTYAIPFYLYFGGTGAFTIGNALNTNQLCDYVNAANGTDTMAVYLTTGSAGNIAIGAASQIFEC